MHKSINRRGSVGMNVLIGIGVLAVLGIGTVIASYFSVNRADVRDRADFVRVEKDRKVVLDKVWNVLEGTSGVDKRAQQAAFDILVSGMEAQAKAGGGSFATATTFAKLDVPNETKVKLQSVIESEWAHFETSQKAVTRLEADINARINDPWTGLFIKNSVPVEAKVIVSSQTHREADSGVMERSTGDLFKNDAPMSRNQRNAEKQ